MASESIPRIPTGAPRKQRRLGNGLLCAMGAKESLTIGIDGQVSVDGHHVGWVTTSHVDVMNRLTDWDGPETEMTIRVMISEAPIGLVWSFDHRSSWDEETGTPVRVQKCVATDGCLVCGPVEKP